MLDSSGQSLGGSFLSRRHSAGDAIRNNSPGMLGSYPPSTPGHDCQSFNAPEGTYCLAHQVFFRSLTPMFSAGTTASLVSIKYKESKGSNVNRYEPHPGARSFRISDDDESLSSSASSHPPETTKSTSFVTPMPSTSTSLTTFSFLSRNSSNRRKSKTNITKTNSSFVARIVTNNQLAKILVARTSEDTNLFYNCGSSFVWMDAFGNPKEPLSRIIFAKACPTSHDVNLLTRGSDHLDIIIGFSTGDIVWFDPLCNKYGRINKGGIMNRSEITMIKWLQGSESLFMAAFADGSIMVFDKDKEDEAFHPGDGSPPQPIYQEKRKHHSTGTVNNTQYHHFPLPVAENPDLRLKVTKPPPKLSAKCNPVSHWKLSNKSCTAFAFSPDCQHVAVVSLDGTLRIINFVHEQLCDIYKSYYGGLTCVAWSPDGRYILTGGQDDLVTIWAFREQRIIARCQGHKSWVTGVAFDAWRCDDKVYRFASVGEDAQLILWDFSVNALHRPKARTSTRLRGASVSSHTGPIPPMIPDQQPNIHPVPSKTQVPLLQPTMCKTVHADPCVGVYFREEAIVTTDRRGRVSVWKRPSSSQNIPTE